MTSKEGCRLAPHKPSFSSENTIGRASTTMETGLLASANLTKESEISSNCLFS